MDKKISFVQQLTNQLKEYQLQKISVNDQNLKQQQKVQYNLAKQTLIQLADLNESTNYQNQDICRWNNKKFDDHSILNDKFSKISKTLSVGPYENNYTCKQNNLFNKQNYQLDSEQRDQRFKSISNRHSFKQDRIKTFSTRKIPQLKQLLEKLQTPKRKKKNQYFDQRKVLTSARRNKQQLNIQPIRFKDQFALSYSKYRQQRNYLQSARKKQIDNCEDRDQRKFNHFQELMNKKGIVSERLSILGIERNTQGLLVSQRNCILAHSNNTNLVTISQSLKKYQKGLKSGNNNQHTYNNQNRNCIVYPMNQTIKLKNSQYQKINRKIINNLMNSNNQVSNNNSNGNSYIFHHGPLSTLNRQINKEVIDQKQILQSLIKNTASKQKDNNQFNYFSNNFKKEQMKKGTLTNLLV